MIVYDQESGFQRQIHNIENTHPMMRLVASEPNATYVTINLGEIYIADNIKEKSFGLDGRLDELLPALREACEA